MRLNRAGDSLDGVETSAEKTPRTERGRKTLRALLDAAALEFGERGYHEASVTTITQRAGIALGSFYTYYSSKEELFRALVGDMSRRVRVHISEQITGAPDRLTAERMGIEAFINFVRANKRLYRIIEESQFVTEEAYRLHYSSFADAYERGLAVARARGEISDGPDEVRSWALIGMSVFLGLRYGVWNEDMTAAEVATIAADLISRGLSPGPARPVSR